MSALPEGSHSSSGFLVFLWLCSQGREGRGEIQNKGEGRNSKRTGGANYKTKRRGGRERVGRKAKQSGGEGVYTKQNLNYGALRARASLGVLL